MSSYLERIPRDILQNIAYLGATMSPLQPPKDLLHLLLSSSSVYASLCIRNSPHLYASIFRTKFDMDAILHKIGGALTDSYLAGELVSRYRVLRRVQQNNFSSTRLREDLWSAINMVLESNDLNEAQLSSVGFSAFIVTLVQSHMVLNDVVGHGDEVNALAIWLLCLTLSRNEIIHMSNEIRQSILDLLRPFTISMSEDTHTNAPLTMAWGTSQRYSSGIDELQRVYTDGNLTGVTDSSQQITLACPRPSSAAIILTFALMETVELDIPYHLPETRSVADATNRSGPTMEDFAKFASYRTPLFADTVLCNLTPNLVSGTFISGISGSARRDQEFVRMSCGPFASGNSYIPGSLTGLWEGSYMVANIDQPRNDTLPINSPMPQFTCRKPMQCTISEYMCFSPHLPLPSLDSPDGMVTVNPCQLVESEGGIALQSEKFRYEKYTQPSSESQRTGRDPCQALDIVIIGETLEEHEQAWGGFNLFGRVRQDGWISLKRESKNASDGLGTWVFEGYLRYDTAFVGRWRSDTTRSDDRGIQGIFSMRRTGFVWQK